MDLVRLPPSFFPLLTLSPQRTPALSAAEFRAEPSSELGSCAVPSCSLVGQPASSVLDAGPGASYVQGLLSTERVPDPPLAYEVSPLKNGTPGRWMALSVKCS